MRSLTSALRLWNTVKHLKFVQIVGRVRFRLSRPKPDLRAAPARRAREGVWCEPAHRRKSLVSPTRFNFLNDERDLDAHGFDDAELPKLWRYNLHYFDDLAAMGAAERVDWHRAFLERWIRENPPARGTGWEPYPTSLRIVNWIKWILAGNEPSEAMRGSLAVQTRWLAQRLEWHLLGNHLFVNAKALLFAGLFFEGAEADAWRATATQILRVQIPEQILADGCQFERSPMYHALAVEDMLDLANIMRAFPNVIDSEFEGLVLGRIGDMRKCLAALCHPDGEISFFNDSAIGIAPSPSELDAYAARLGGAERIAIADGVTHLREAGYIRVQRGAMVAILDVGLIGPDYLPGHAHADTLSMEVSVAGERVLANCGTGMYGLGAERLRQRGTAAHNTVSVAGADSSEVWSGFRVARRARPFGLAVDAEADRIVISCSHDGFHRLPGSPTHTRKWVFAANSIDVSDVVTYGASRHGRYGTGKSQAASDGVRVDGESPSAGGNEYGTGKHGDRPNRTTPATAHWHCAVGVHQTGPNTAQLTPAKAPPIAVTTIGSALAIAPTTFHPEFGLIRYQRKIVVAIPGASITTRFVW